VRKQAPSKFNFIQTGLQRPTLSRSSKPAQIALDRAFAHLADRRDLTRAELGFKVEAKDFSRVSDG
jgi:hypothetical protein